MSYEPVSVNAPRLTGLPLRLLAAALESRWLSALIAPGLLRQLGLPRFRELPVDSPPTFLPWVNPPGDQGPPGGKSGASDAVVQVQQMQVQVQLQALVAPPRNSRRLPADMARRAGVADYHRAYSTGQTTPEQVAQALLRAIREADEGQDPSTPVIGQQGTPLRAFVAVDEADVLAQARAAGERWRRGQPLSPLDGVPVAVKDELDLRGYPTGGGARVFPATAASRDAAVVAPLRAAGAILCGKANMHEVGIGVTGMNPVTGFVRNPWNLQHATGGSSAGSAAAVAAGLVPLALGADGGGSIRIPSALCGVVGIKPTFGRVDDAGSLRLCWSVGHLGPIGGSARDCALGYLLCAQAPGPGAPLGDRLLQFDADDLAGVRLGIYRPWFEHARPQVVQVCQQMLTFLQQRGASLVEVELPGLEAIRLGHGLTVAAEIAAALEGVYRAGRQTRLSAETRINVALAGQANSLDYVRAQRVRTQAIAVFQQALSQVDALVTPTTGCTAPPIRPDALASGESDLGVLTELMRFVVAANFTGVPAISFPAGFAPDGLPVGLQAMAAWWNEPLLLRLANVAEQAEHVQPPRRPQVFHDPLV